MFSQLAVMMHKIGDRTYHFLCDPNSPFSEVKESLFQFTKSIGKLEEQQLEKTTTEKEEKSEEPDVQPPV